MAEVENGIITAVRWNRERGLTQYITVEGDHWGCSIGGYGLNGVACAEWISALMDVLDVSDFRESEIIGRVVRVKHEGPGRALVAIGHPVKDKWLEPKVLFAKYAKE